MAEPVSVQAPRTAVAPQGTNVEVAADTKSAGWGVFWWTLSISLHAVLIGAIIWFTPFREWFLSPHDPDEQAKTLEGQQVEYMARTLFDVHTKRVIEKIEELKGITRKVSDLRDKGWKRYTSDLKFYKSAAGGALPDDPIKAMGPAGPDINVSLVGKDVGQLYDVARDIEKTAYGTYRQIRAVELARLQNLPLKEALDNTNVAVPTHPEVNVSIFRQTITNATDGKLDALKKELLVVRTEVESMVAAATRMLDMAHGLIPDDVGSTVVPGTAAGAFQGAEAGEGESGRGRTRGAVEQGYTPMDPSGFAHQWGIGVGPVTHRKQIYAREKGLNLGRTPPTPATKLMEGLGTQVSADGWMYIDTWYIIGPFPNPGRKGIDEKYPPEVQGTNGVDMDAVYIGKDGQKLSWQWRKSWDVCVVPHKPMDEAVYYAYTEVYSDKDQDRWTIFGSDDWGRCWMNGEVIYTSGKTPHPWVPDRGIKKVHFKKGYNQILFKFENAWGRTGFSMCINLREL